MRWAAGSSLQAAADIRIAESQIRIGLPETGLGMVPGLVRHAAAGEARSARRSCVAWPLGGEMFTAEEAAAARRRRRGRSDRNSRSTQPRNMPGALRRGDRPRSKSRS